MKRVHNISIVGGTAPLKIKASLGIIKFWTERCKQAVFSVDTWRPKHGPLGILFIQEYRGVGANLVNKLALIVCPGTWRNYLVKWWASYLRQKLWAVGLHALRPVFYMKLREHLILLRTFSTNSNRRSNL